MRESSRNADAWYDGLALVMERVEQGGDSAPWVNTVRYHHDTHGLHAITAHHDGLGSARSTHFAHRDGIGSTIAVSRPAPLGPDGLVAASWRTDPWGVITAETGVDHVNHSIFTGHQHDFDTGLIYMRARFYDPGLGRFLTADSWLGEADNPPSLQRYLYAYGNPGVWWDPTGHWSQALSEQVMTRGERELQRDYMRSHFAARSGGDPRRSGAGYRFGSQHDLVTLSLEEARQSPDWFEQHIIKREAAVWTEDRNLRIYVEGGQSVIIESRHVAVHRQHRAERVRVARDRKTGLLFPAAEVRIEGGVSIVELAPPNMRPYFDGDATPLLYDEWSFRESLSIATEFANIVSWNITGRLFDVSHRALGRLLGRRVQSGLPDLPSGYHYRFRANGEIEVVRNAGMKSRLFPLRLQGKRLVPVFDERNFRGNLSVLTGRTPRGHHAHHNLPQEFIEEFRRLGINIHEPRFGAWVPRRKHLREARAFNANAARIA